MKQEADCTDKTTHIERSDCDYCNAKKGMVEQEAHRTTNECCVRVERRCAYADQTFSLAGCD